MFKFIGVLKEIKKRKNQTKKYIQAQQKELKDTVPYEAKIAQTLKINEMCFEKLPDLESITIEVDDKSTELVDQYIEKELKDYIVHKHEDNVNLYDFTIKTIDI